MASSAASRELLSRNFYTDLGPQEMWVWLYSKKQVFKILNLMAIIFLIKKFFLSNRL